MIVQCPNCGETLESDGEIAEGQHVHCPCCDTKFEYTSRKTMCPNCKSELAIPYGLEGGQQLQCPYCEEVFTYKQFALQNPIRISLPEKNRSVKSSSDGRGKWRWMFDLFVTSEYLWLSLIRHITAKGRTGRFEYALEIEKAMLWTGLALFLGRVPPDEVPPAALVVFLLSAIGFISLLIFSIRRLHDFNRTGWWLCVPFIFSVPIDLGFGVPSALLTNVVFFVGPIALLFLPAVESNNRFGARIAFSVPKPQRKHYLFCLFLTLLKFWAIGIIVMAWAHGSLRSPKDPPRLRQVPMQGTAVRISAEQQYKKNKMLYESLLERYDLKEQIFMHRETFVMLALLYNDREVVQISFIPETQEIRWPRHVSKELAVSLITTRYAIKMYEDPNVDPILDIKPDFDALPIKEAE